MSCPKCDEVRQALLILQKFIEEEKSGPVVVGNPVYSPPSFVVVNGNEYAPRGFDEE